VCTELRSCFEEHAYAVQRRQALLFDLMQRPGLRLVCIVDRRQLEIDSRTAQAIEHCRCGNLPAGYRAANLLVGAWIVVGGLGD